MDKAKLKLGSVPVRVAARVYGRDPAWVRAGIIAGWLPIGQATRNGHTVTDIRQNGTTSSSTSAASTMIGKKHSTTSTDGSFHPAIFREFSKVTLRKVRRSARRLHESITQAILIFWKGACGNSIQRSGRTY